MNELLFDMSFHAEKKMSKGSCSPLALRNVHSFRMQAQEISLHLSHTFSFVQENLFPWLRDL